MKAGQIVLTTLRNGSSFIEPATFKTVLLFFQHLEKELWLR